MKRLVALLSLLILASQARAITPQQVALGQQLFVQEFAPMTPGLEGDGLGPVFNESSCVACHNVGGIGGSGTVSSNARSLGLSEVELPPIKPIDGSGRGKRGDSSQIESEFAAFAQGSVTATAAFRLLFRCIAAGARTRSPICETSR